MSSFIALITFIAASFFTTDPNFTVKGIVKDKVTNEPIPFAHVVVGDIVNVSNIDGEFIISSKSLEDQDTRLMVSYIGYNEFQKPIEEMGAYQTIYLEPSVTSLEEVTVMTGPSVMQEVFDRFHINYPMERQHMVGYYRESMKNWQETYYVAEGIMDIYAPNDLDKVKQPLVKPLRTRKKVFKELSLDEDILEGNASDMAHSSIWRKESFLSSKNRNNYDFFYAGVTTMGQHEVYIVEFEPNNAKGNTKGKLYIEEESYAIIKIAYHPILDDWKFWESVSWTEEYEQRGGHFEMVSVTFQGNSTNHTYQYDAHLVINESEPINYLPNKYGLLDQSDSFFEEAEDNFSDDFWTGFNFMKLDSNIADLMGE